MPPKSQKKMRDIRDFLKRQSDSPGRSSSSKASPQPEGATAFQSATQTSARMKKESDCDAMGPHSHHFTVKFSQAGHNEYTVVCNQPCTLLEAIKSIEKSKKMIKCADENIIIQLEKGMTVEEALKMDGRFIDDLGYFELSDKKKPNSRTECTQNVNYLHQKKFKICLPLNKKENDEKQHENPSDNVDRKRKRRSGSEILAIAQQEGISVKTVIEKPSNSVDTEKIYELLREQFPDLKKWMENRFPGDSYQDALKLRKENFGKTQQSFSEVYRIRKVLQLGKSVCKVSVKGVSDGTGFVLFDRFILTNAHLFQGYVDGKELQQEVEVYAIFDYEDPEPITNLYCFTADNTFVDFDVELDYAILELNPEGCEPNMKSKVKKVPPGLLNKFGPMPPNGEACIIGHPAGGVKKMDPTFIIEKEKRGQAVDDHLSPYKDNLFIIQSISDIIRKQGIENILTGRNKEDVVTFNTFMYHGASGSPVLDGLGRVFGLHTAGFTYGFPNHTESVIEYAHPLLTIFKKFVGNLKESGNEELLKRVEEAAKGNQHLEKVLMADQEDPEESMDISN